MRWIPVIAFVAERWTREAQALDGHRKPDLGWRRKHPRWQWAGGLGLRRHGESEIHRVRAEDVSYGGLCVQGTVALADGDFVELNKTGEDAWVPARVAYVTALPHDPGMFWIGLAFVRADGIEEAVPTSR